MINITIIIHATTRITSTVETRQINMDQKGKNKGKRKLTTIDSDHEDNNIKKIEVFE